MGSLTSEALTEGGDRRSAPEGSQERRQCDCAELGTGRSTEGVSTADWSVGKGFVPRRSRGDWTWLGREEAPPGPGEGVTSLGRGRVQ